MYSVSIHGYIMNHIEIVSSAHVKSTPIYVYAHISSFSWICKKTLMHFHSYIEVFTYTTNRASQSIFLIRIGFGFLVLSTLVSIATVDRLGRRTLFFGGGILMISCQVRAKLTHGRPFLILLHLVFKHVSIHPRCMWLFRW